MGFNVVKKVQEAGMILGALGVIGFIGIVWIMIYGNLSGNLGFTQDSLSFVNETVNINGVYDTPASALGLPNPTLSGIIITNNSCGDTLNAGCIVGSGNYTLRGASINVSLTSEWMASANIWNVTATVNYDSTGLVSSENVISNLTSGFDTFFGFSNVLFTIAAIVLLIFMLLGLLALVMTIVNMQKGKGGFSKY